MKQQNILKNTCKNIALVMLTLLLAVLVVLTWGTALGQSNIPPDSLLTQLYAVLSFENAGYVQRAGDTPAAYPSAIAMTTEKGLRGAFYSEATVGGIYDTVRPVWAAALPKAKNFEAATQEQLRTVLAAEDTLYLSYNSGLPLGLLAEWLGADTAQVEDRTVISLVLTRSGTLIVRSGEDGKLYRTREKLHVQDSLWKDTANRITAPACEYAGVLDRSVFGALLPESLVPANTVAYDVFKVRLPAFGDVGSGDSLQTLLKAFDYDPYVQNYLENNGTTQVFVENYSSLRVSNDGIVTFKANSIMGGLAVYQDGEMAQPEALAAQADYAAGVLNSALSAIGSTIPAELQNVQYDEQTGTQYLEFAQVIGSVPVWQKGKPLARFSFQKGTLVAAELSLRDYHATGEKLYVLPVKQTAAAIQGNGTSQYIVAYTDDDSGRLIAKTYSRNWGGQQCSGIK